MLTFEHHSPQRPAETGNFRIDKPSSPPVEPLHDGESINAERALVLKDQYYAELLRLQSVEAKDERNKDKVVALAKGIIFCLKIILNGKVSDSQLQEQRSSGFNKSMKDKLYRRLGGCLACGEGTMSSSSRHSAPIELHHIVLRLYGGDDLASNALLVCRGCHGQIHS